MNHRPIPPIWVINLRRSVNRHNFIRAELDRLDLDYELVEAVDGRELGPEELSAIYNPSAAVELIRRELTLGEVGCSLSHLRLYQRQVEEGHEEVVILEDDVNIDPSFPDILRRREAFPADWELVLFHRVNNPPVSFWGSRRIDRHHRCVKFASIVERNGGLSHPPERRPEVVGPRLSRSRPGRLSDRRQVQDGCLSLRSRPPLHPALRLRPGSLHHAGSLFVAPQETVSKGGGPCALGPPPHEVGLAVSIEENRSKLDRMTPVVEGAGFRLHSPLL